MSIDVTRDGNIAIITLNRPEKLNAMTGEMYMAISSAFLQLERDEEVLVGIVTGAGDRAFSSGADLASMHGGNGGSWGWFPYRANRFDIGLECAKPLIAAINGYCLAGGLELALACDIRIASENATFGAPEVKWGILHGYGALRLPRLIPMSTAMELLLTGDFIDAREALRIGLVSRVVPAPELIATARTIAERVAKNGPMAVGMTKELALRGQDMRLQDGLRLYQEYNRIAHASEDAAEGVRAFVERREPKFKGR
jgi:E-phenylitaconyl-CoA hydratase